VRGHVWELVELTCVDCNKNWQKATIYLVDLGSKVAADALAKEGACYLFITK
jgi:hypothetical protein